MNATFLAILISLRQILRSKVELRPQPPRLVIEDMRTNNPPEVPETPGDTGGKRHQDVIVAPGNDQNPRKKQRQEDQMDTDREVETTTTTCKIEVVETVEDEVEVVDDRVEVRLDKKSKVPRAL